MNIGAMRHRVTLQMRSVTKDAYGQEIETFTTSISRWASIVVTGNAKGALYEGQLASEGIEMTMRPLETLTVLSRVVALGATYSVTSITDVDGRGIESVVTAERMR